MVALLVRLKLTLLKNSLKRSVWRTVGLIVGMLYALGVVLVALAGLVALRYTSVALTGDVTVVAFSVLTLGWLVMSMLLYGVDETVDPGKFALLPLRARELLPGLFVAGLVGTPGVATIVVCAGLVVTWARGPAAAAAAIVAFPLGVATCFLLSRAGTAMFASLLSSRRFRDFTVVALALSGGVIALAANLLGGLASQDTDQLRQDVTVTATTLGWTPFGWVWAVPADVAAGQWGTAVLRLVLAVAFAGLLWAVWGHFLGKRLVEPIEPGGDARKVHHSSLADRLYPATPAGGVARRTLSYWRRDPRYLAGIGGFLIAPVIIMVSLSIGSEGGSTVVAFTPALLAALVGITLASDLSYDGTAIWLHICTGITGAEDRRGRIMSSATVFAPLLAALMAAGILVTGSEDLVAPVAATTVVLALTGFGVGAWVGALWQWPAAPPGANPFQTGNSGGLPAMLAYSLAILATFIASLPALALVVASFWISWLGYAALAVAIATGSIALRIGIAKGGALLDRRWPEVMKAVSEKSA